MYDYNKNINHIYDCSKIDKTESPNVTLKKLSSTIDGYSNLIKDFFYHNQYVDRDEIKKIYDDINKNKFSNKTVCCVDVRKATETYNEYNAGMLEFISEIIKNANLNSDTIEDSSSYNDSLNKACSKDKDFIISLFDDSECEERNLSDALYNFEFMIDFIDVCKKMVANASSVINGIDYTHSDMCVSSELINRSVKLLYDSIAEFVYRAILNMATTYQKIINSINTEEVPDVKLRLF
jgi:hypothetical protein